MNQLVTISGITCSSCVEKITKELQSHEDIRSVSINKDSGAAILEVDHELSLEDIESRLAPLKKYHVLPQPTKKPVEPGEERANYWPLVLIALYIIGGTALTTFLRGGPEFLMRDAMTLYLFLFGFVQLIDLKGFAQMYRGYDPLTRALPGWGYVFPPLEVVLAGALQLQLHDPTVIGIIFVLTLQNTYGVVRTVLSPLKIRCACMGSAIALPVGWVTIVENLLMLGMAGWMGWQLFM